MTASAEKPDRFYLKYPELNSGIFEKATYSVRKDTNGGKKRVTTLLSGYPEVGEEFPKTDLWHFGERSVTVKCVDGEGYVLIMQFKRDNNRRVLPNEKVNFIIQFFKKNHEVVIPPNNFCEFGNTGSQSLILEDDSLEKNSERTDPENLFIWPSVSDLIMVRNIGFQQTFTKGKGTFPVLAENPFYGKNAENGNLFSRN